MFFDFKFVNCKIIKVFSEWVCLGVVGLDGELVCNFGKVFVFLSGGYCGVVFLIFDNFVVIEKYNIVDVYVIGVGYLSDCIIGGGVFKLGWFYGDCVFIFDECKEL